MSAPPAHEGGGERFGRFRLLGRIGVGGMGEVYRALADGAAGFARPLALKRLRPSLSSDAGFVRAFLAEARLAARLRHPGIVQVYELDRAGDEHYLAMELVDGVDLGRLNSALRRRSEKFPAAAACHLAIEIAEALDYAHALTGDDGRPLGLVHRDVSPANLMVTVHGAVKLLDFGIARSSDRIADDKTRTGVIKGKVAYLSPEQADGRPADPRSDLFSLGVVLYECVAGKRLFTALDELATLKRVREADLPSPLVPGLDEELAAVLSRLLARAPADRFARASEVVDALSPIAHRLGGDAYTLGRFVANWREAADDESPPSVTVEHSPAPRRKLWPF